MTYQGEGKLELTFVLLLFISITISETHGYITWIDDKWRAFTGVLSALQVHSYQFSLK